jgi:hypothetical protein
MIEKPLYIVITVYCISFSVLAGQYFINEFMDITLTNWEGAPIKANILALSNMTELNALAADFSGAESQSNSTLAPIENAFNIGLNIGWEILTLLTGTYIFNFMYFMGVPWYFVAGMSIVYFFMLGRTIIAYVRGV